MTHEHQMNQIIEMMSVVQEEGPWNEANLARRQLKALDSKHKADVTVHVKNETFQCHSFPLIMASPKFESMLQKNELRLPEVEAQHFRLLLEIIYSGETVSDMNLEQLLCLVQTAHELQVQAAVVYCTKRLGDLVNIGNVWQILDFARLIKNPELEEICVKVVRKNAGTILHTEEFLHCERETLEAILRMDELSNVDEVQLFRACTRWATAHCQGIKTPRAVLGSALQLIRFRTMSAEQFAEHVCPTKILTPEEQSVILQCIVTGKDEFIPKGFSIETRPRGEEFRVGTAVEVELNWSVCQFRTAGEIAASPLRISVSADAYILGVKLRAWREGKRHGERYDQNVEVTLKDSDGIDLTSASFVGLVKNCDWITLWFERPYAIYAEAIYTLHLVYSEPQVRHWCWAYQKQTKKIYSRMEFRLLEQVQSTRIHCIVAEKIRV